MHLKSSGLWLLASGALHAAALPTQDCFNSLIDDRSKYLSCAKEYGLCRPNKDEGGHGSSSNDRKMVIPGPSILAKFDVCVAKNEFGEDLLDTSGDIFCQGQAIHLMADAAYDPNSKNKIDSKAFVDLSRTVSGKELNHALSRLHGSSSLTVKNFLTKWNETSIARDQELTVYENKRFPNTPAFIFDIRPQARILRAWIKMVHHKWNILGREMLQSYRDYLLPGPGSTELKDSKAEEKYITSAIRLEHPFVIAGGRFREQYYWDSFFVMEGLLAANMSYLARTTLLNFMDQIKSYGFIPNGARKYYLNRSQPPLFIHMLHAYVHNTNDYRILHEALPLAERELRWWSKNRSVKVAVKGSDRIHTVYQYRVNATGPRPESYAEDWRSAWCFEAEAPARDKENKLYSEFASGAESGWDYTARWMNDPFKLPETELEQMKKIEIRRMVPVDLNSIIYRCHTIMADLYQLAKDNESPFADQHAEDHTKKADDLKHAIVTLHWDSHNATFFDFILDEEYADDKVYSGRRKEFWSVASLAPYWSGVWPREFECDGDDDDDNERSKLAVMRAFSGVRKLVDTYHGPLPATLVKSGQQWDFPNAWPPLQYIAIKALENIPEKCLKKTTVDEFIKTEPPEGQLVVTELPDQPKKELLPKVDYYVAHSWRDSLVKTLVMRYITSTFCNWNRTGNFPEDRAEVIERNNPERDPALKDHAGDMFEKLNAVSPIKAGEGGEYEVQTGFGWTNGIAIWIAHQYGVILNDPKCPPPETKQKDLSGDDLVFQT